MGIAVRGVRQLCFDWVLGLFKVFEEPGLESCESEGLGLDARFRGHDGSDGLKTKW